MPLSDLIRTLNSPSHAFPKHYAASGLDQPFVAKDGKIFLHYANIRIESRFLPIIETTSGNLYGHAASIQAFGLSNGIQMAPEAVFVLPSDDEEFVYLDRLVRPLAEPRQFAAQCPSTSCTQRPGTPWSGFRGNSQAMWLVSRTNHPGNQHGPYRRHRSSGSRDSQLSLARLWCCRQPIWAQPTRFWTVARTATHSGQTRPFAACLSQAAHPDYRLPAQTPQQGDDRRHRFEFAQKDSQCQRNRPGPGQLATLAEHHTTGCRQE